MSPPTHPVSSPGALVSKKKSQQSQQKLKEGKKQLWAMVSRQVVGKWTPKGDHVSSQPS